MVSWHGEPPDARRRCRRSRRLGVRHAFTTRHHGSFDARLGAAPVRSAARRWPALAALGLEPGSVRYARQVHGSACLDADDAAARAGCCGAGDALVTRQRARPLAVFTADCVALIVADPERPALGRGARGMARHRAGHRGPARRRRWSSAAGARAERLRAAIGPSIGPVLLRGRRARASGRLRAAFPEAWERLGAPGAPDRPGHWWLDLWAANADQLAAAGVRAGRDLEPAPVHRLPAGPVLLVPEGGDGRAASRRSRCSTRTVPVARASWRRGGEPATIPTAHDRDPISAPTSPPSGSGSPTRPAGPAAATDAVLLVAVSKTVDVERVRAAIAAGVPDLGENRVQEARGEDPGRGATPSALAPHRAPAVEQGRNAARRPSFELHPDARFGSGWPRRSIVTSKGSGRPAPLRRLDRGQRERARRPSTV